MGDPYIEGQEDEDEDETEELSEFGEMLNNTFEDSEMPYSSEISMDDYDPEEYLSEKQYDMLELYMIFPQGWEREKYSASDRMVNENDITLVTVTYLDEMTSELSVYLVTYNKDEWYVDHEMIAYDGFGEGFLTFKSEISNDTVYRRNYIDIDTEVIEELEVLWVDEDGIIVSENDL